MKRSGGLKFLFRQLTSIAASGTFEDPVIITENGQSNGVIRKVTAAGGVATLVGLAGIQGSVDGTRAPRTWLAYHSDHRPYEQLQDVTSGRLPNQTI